MPIVPPGQLVVEIAGVERLRPAGGKAFRICKTREIAADFSERLIVDIDLMSQRAQIGHDPLRRRIGNAVRGGAGGALNGADAPFRCVHICQLAYSDRAVGVQFQRFLADDRLHGGYQRAGAQRRQKTAGILDIERVDVGAFGKSSCAGHVVGVVVNRAQRKDQRADDVFAPGGLDHARAGDVRIRVVHRIGQRESAYSILDERLESERHELGTGRFPGDKTKARGEELQRRFGMALAMSRMRSQGSSFL